MPYFPDNTPIITDFNPIPGQTSFQNTVYTAKLHPEVNTKIYYPDGTGTLPSHIETLQIPNVQELYGTSVYSEFRIGYVLSPVRRDIINGRITLASDIIDVTANPATGFLLDGTRQSFDITFNYQNLDAEPYGDDESFLGIYLIRIYGKKISDNLWYTLSQTTINQKVQKVTTGNFYIEPNKVNFNHLLGDIARPVIPVSIYAGASSPVYLTLKEDFELVGANVPTPVTLFGRTAYSFADASNIEVSLKASADARVNELRVDENVLEVYFASAYADRKYLKADILVSSTTEFIFQPQMLQFLMILGADNNITKTLQVFGNGYWTLSAPSWLLRSKSNGSNLESIEIEPIDEDYFTPGIYQNDIILTANTKQYKIPARLKVAERFELGLSKSGLNFTDENQAVTKIYNNSPVERLVIVDVEIPQIGYPYATVQPKTYQYRLGFFQNETSIHIGEIVKRSLTHLDAQVVYDLLSGYINSGVISSNLLEYYKPSSVRINMQLLNASDNSLVEAQEHKLIRFITGRNPFFEDNLALLRDKNVEQKVSKNSIRFINFVTQKNVILEVYKNGDLYDSFPKNISVERLYGLVVSFDDFEIGDEIEYRLYSNAIDGITGFQNQTFILYPETKHFNQVIYEDEYRVPQFFDFCGDWSFSTENEFIQSIDVINLVEAIQNEKSIKTHSLVMNTGYIPATNQIFVEQLKNSRNCWLLGNATEPLIELVPKAYNMVNYDSDQDLYQYEVEFQINPTNDLQNYS